ncbi:MAG: hypothetical protein NZ895_04420 [Archaeoglobaceae archaeon]|nr:hypothetical protein [Archaeoglobaceae archaeon]MCX8152585.1 DUF166 family protein [Archaeoglobaceae archaeon]MDW8014133.1 DUF166 family protein [Archaeoglobaceae archaeon]
MRVAFIYGENCERFVCNFAFPKYCSTFGACGVSCDFCKNYDYSSSVVFAEKVPNSGDLEEFKIDPFECDVLVVLNVHPDVLLNIFDVEFKALIVPVEDPRWLRPGLRLQVSKLCEEFGIDFAAPKPFCSLKGKGLIKKFSDEFKIGFPEFEVDLDGDAIRKVRVLRSDPCGSSYYVAKMMSGFILKDEQSLYSEVHKHQCSYPCTASMNRDPELGESPFHLAGYLMVYSFAKACGIDSKYFVPQKFWKFLD